MEKYITFAVEEHMTGQTVEKVLRTALNLTKKQISRAKFQTDGIRKNGVQCRTTDIVQTSDQIMICIEAAKNDLNHLVSFCEDAHPLEILYEDEDKQASRNTYSPFRCTLRRHTFQSGIRIFS